MKAALTAAFSPSRLEIIDDSALHHGHAGATPEGETHFTVRIRAASLAGLSRVAKHRAIHAALAQEFANGLHALAIEAE